MDNSFSLLWRTAASRYFGEFYYCQFQSGVALKVNVLLATENFAAYTKEVMHTNHACANNITKAIRKTLKTFRNQKSLVALHVDVDMDIHAPTDDGN